MLLTLTVMASGCINDPCPGYPKRIQMFEHVRVQILNKVGQDIFEGNFQLNNLRILEDGVEIAYQVDHGMEPFISFPVSCNTEKAIESNWGQKVSTSLYFRLDSLDVDTMTIELIPVKHDEKCPWQEYAAITIMYNGRSIKHNISHSCISCIQPIKLIKY